MYFLLCPFGCDAKGQRRRYQRRKRKTRDKNDNHYALTGIYLCSASPNLAAQLSQERLICMLYVANMQLCCNSERENEQALACKSIQCSAEGWCGYPFSPVFLFFTWYFFSSLYLRIKEKKRSTFKTIISIIYKIFHQKIYSGVLDGIIL